MTPLVGVREDHVPLSAQIKAVQLRIKWIVFLGSCLVVNDVYHHYIVWPSNGHTYGCLKHWGLMYKIELPNGRELQATVAELRARKQETTLLLRCPGKTKESRGAARLACKTLDQPNTDTRNPLKNPEMMLTDAKLNPCPRQPHIKCYDS